MTSRSPNSRATGTFLVVLAAVGFGFMGLFGSWAMRDGVSVEMLLFLRFAIAGVMMVALAQWRQLPWPPRRTFVGFMAMGGVLYVGESLFFFHAIRHIPVGLVSLLLYIYPVVVTLFAWLVWKEKLTATRLLALLLAATGLAFTIGPTLMDKSIPVDSQARPALGVALGIGCCVSYAIYILLGGPMTRRAGAIVGSTIVICSAAVVLGALTLYRGDSLPQTSSAWIGIGLLAIISTVVSITCVLVGLDQIGAVQTSTLSTLEPVITVLVGAIFMNQRLSLIQIAGGSLIVVAALIIAKRQAPIKDGCE